MKKKLFKLIGIVIFIIILIKIDLSDSLEIIKNINLVYFISAVSLVFPIILLKAIRWKGLMVDQKLLAPSFSLYEIYEVYFIAMFFGVVTPGRMGELVKIKYLKSMGHSYAASAVSVVLDRVLDVISLFAICLFMAFIYFKYTKVELLAVNVLFITGLLLVFFSVRGIREGKVQEKYSWIKNQFVQKVIKNVSELVEGVKTISLKSLFVSLMITFAAWYIYFLRAFWIMKSIGISASFPFMVFCISISAFLSFIPVTYLGLGTRELVIMHYFSKINISRECSVAFSSMIFLAIVLSSLIGLIIYLFRKEGLSYGGEIG